jgi:8-oxo-(d)GTP phosphatase
VSVRHRRSAAGSPRLSVTGPATRSGNGHRGPAPDQAEVQAAGVLCWRPTDSGLQVLLVRSAKHGEWSWPKGRLEAAETLPECAVRETLEETGQQVRLGVPLGCTGYTLPDGRSKSVTYWAARTTGPDRYPTVPPAAAAAEISELAWVPVHRAAERLPYPEHHQPLAELTALAANGRLDSTPVLVLRHASARSRQAWSGRDADRPLSGKGRRQAAALPGLLDCWSPVRLVSSPWRRCVDTITPYAAVVARTVITDPSLSEAGHRSAPQVAPARVEELIAGAEPALLCTHRPVLGSLFHAVGEHATPGVSAALPSDDPYLRPSEVLVTHVVRDPDGSHGGWGGWAVAAVERHRPARG